MSAERSVLMVSALLLALSGPVALAAWVARAPVPVAAAVSAVAATVAPRLVAQSANTGPTGETPAARPNSATLYTNGPVNIDWQGRQFVVENGVYPYLGNELIKVPRGSMGVLRIGTDAFVFMCAGSVSRVSQADSGLALNLVRGSARIISKSGTPLAVNTGDQALTPVESQEAGAYAVEVDVGSGGSVTVLPLQGTVRMSHRVVASGEKTKVWSRRRGDDMWDSRDFPSDLARPAAITASLDNALTGGDYLCRTVELAQIARQGRVTNPVGQLADVPPFLVPPGAPPLALASPQAQDIFDPNALPAPAAGPGAPVVTVPVPAAPTSGGGGGTLATPE